MVFFVLYFIFIILFILFLIGTSIFLLGLIFSILKGAPYVPTSKGIIKDILKHAQLKKGLRFLELGAGTGRIVEEAVSKYGVNGTGVEINPLLFSGAKLRGWLSKLDTLVFIQKDVRDISYENYDRIYLYLFPALIEKIQDKFVSETKKGTIFISHGFRIPALKEKLFYTLEGHAFKTFYYKI
jgi:SAM-dependent methyltransferase